MSAISAIKNIIIYKGPKTDQRFELLEDESEDMRDLSFAKMQYDSGDMQGGETAEAQEDSEYAEDESAEAQEDSEYAEDESAETEQPDESSGEDDTPDSEHPPGRFKRLIQSLRKSRAPKQDSQSEDSKAKDSKAKDTKSTEDTKSCHSDDSSSDVSPKLGKNLLRIKKEFHVPTNKDIVIREFVVKQQTSAFIVYVDGMADKVTINDYILRQLMAENEAEDAAEIDLDYITDNLLSINQLSRVKAFDQIIEQVLNGLTALFVDGYKECIVIESRGYEKRSVEKPISEQVIHGSQEAFNENLRTNLTLMRRIIRNKGLVTEFMPMGKVNNMTCAIMYIEGIANPKIVKEVTRRIVSLDADIIMGSGGLAQLISDHPLSPVPTILTTERPDRTALYLTQGKIAILVDGSPFACLVPVTYYQFFHSPEDFDLKWQYGTFLRYIRWGAALLALLLPGVFLALTLYHQEMIPTELLFALSQAREKVPLPSVLELLLMELTFGKRD